MLTLRIIWEASFFWPKGKWANPFSYVKGIGICAGMGSANFSVGNRPHWMSLLGAERKKVLIISPSAFKMG